MICAPPACHVIYGALPFSSGVPVKANYALAGTERATRRQGGALQWQTAGATVREDEIRRA